MIKSFAFSNCKNLLHVTIPSTVKLIEQSAFNGCTLLTNIIIPSSVESIEQNCFEDCESLKEMIIPSSVKIIGDHFISGCTSLEKVIIPTTTAIGLFNFNFFSHLTEFIIPSSVKSIDERAFSRCTSLAKIEIPTSVVNIYEYAFYECTSLKEIAIPNSVMKISESTFNGCSSLVNVIIPSSVTSIEYNAFKDCTSLVNITIPSSVKSIGCDAFEGCKMLTKITYENDPSKLEILSKSFKLKISILGPEKAGKTSLLERYVNGHIIDTYNSTIGIDTEIKNIDIIGNNVELILLDTTSSASFQSFSAFFYRGSDCMVAVFDLNNRNSFNYCKKMVKDFFDSYKPLASILIGNKSDLNHDVPNEDIELLVNEYNIKYFEVSVVNNSNIDEAFKYVVTEAIKDDLEEENRLKKLINDGFMNQNGD